MNPMPDIAALLKTLRLSNMMDNLETRNREAIENKLSFTKFLATLLQDECSMGYQMANLVHARS
jgi:hypothetical protein